MGGGDPPNLLFAFRMMQSPANIPLRLSPMAGFTDAPMRLIAQEFGAAHTYTEMANAAGLAHSNGETWQLLETLPGEHDVSAHLYGDDPDAFARAAELVAKCGRFVAIDVNAGCPAPKITRGGAGSALMRDPARIGAIVAAARKASGMPVTVKTRLGYSPSDITVFDVLRAVEDAGGAALAVHGRYRSQGHAGPVALDLVAEVKRRAGIPVYGNGGVRDAASARAFAEATGVDALLVGQAALGHPWVFAEIPSGVSFEATASRAAALPLDEIRRVLFRHLDLEHEFIKEMAAKYPRAYFDDTPERLLLIRFRCGLFRYLAGLKGASYARGRLVHVHTLAALRDVIDACLEREAARRAAAPSAGTIEGGRG